MAGGSQPSAGCGCAVLPKARDERGRPWRFLADLDGGVGGEFVGRDDQVERRRPLPDPPRGVVDRAVAWAEPAAERAAVIAGLVAKRDAAEMRAHPDHDQPFRLFDPLGILLRVA